MTKRFLLIPAMALIATVSFSQTTKPKLDEVQNNPKTTQHAATAEAKVANNKAVVDSAALKTIFIRKREERAAQRKRHQQRKTS